MKTRIALLALALSISSAHASITPLLNNGDALPITQKMDSTCLKQLHNVPELRSAVIDYALDNNTIESWPLWPVVCPLVSASSSASAVRIGQDIEITFTSKTPSKTKSRFTFQRVISDDLTVETYQIAAVDSTSMMSYEMQTDLRNMMLHMNEQSINDPRNQ